MDNGILIKDMARLLGVTQETIINWERRGVRPTMEHMKKVKGLFPSDS